MGIFGDDERQDERLDALETHVRALTETVHGLQLDSADLQISLISLQKSLEKKLNEKLSTSDVDPAFVELHDKLAAARKQAEETSKAAKESWATLEGSTHEALDTLRSGVQEASDRLKKA